MRLFVASSFLLATPLLAQQFPEVEPNDLPAQAQLVPLGQQVNCNLVAAESDWFSFTTGGGYHGIHTSGGATVQTDTRMTLWDATGTTCIAYCDDSQAFQGSLWMNLAAGTYLVKIDGFGTTSAGLYSLDISLPVAKPLTGNEAEPNDTPATANTVGDGAQIGGALTPPVLGLFPNTVPGGAVVASNTVTSSTTTVITAGTGLVAGTYNGAGYMVSMTSGAQAGQSRRITANTATTITTEAWAAAPAATDTFDIIDVAEVVGAGTVTTSTTTTITPATPPPFTGYYTPSVAYSMRMLTGPNAGLSRTISSSSATGITTSAWPVANTAGDTFQIVTGGSTGSVRVTTPLVAGQFDDSSYWLTCVTGANAGQTRCILRNTATTINLVAAFTTAPRPGDTFVVDQYDCDTYRIDVTAPVAEVVFSITDGDNNWVSGWSYAVVDATGARVNPVTLGTHLADSSTLNPRVSSFRVWPTGSYYVRVFQRRTTFTTTAATVPYGNYRFEVKVRDMAVGGTVTETEPVGGPDSNSTTATAVALNPGQRGVGNITNNAGTDLSDWWGPINVTSQTLITFQVSGTGASPLVDGSVNLRQVTDPVVGSTAATLVTSGNTLELTNLNPRGSFNFLLPGTQYYLEVTSPGAGATQGGDYILDVSLADAPTYAVGNWAQVAANGTGCGTAGVPTITRVQGDAANTFGELPIIGETLVTRVSNLNGLGNFGLMVLGTSGVLGPSGAPAGSAPSVYNPQPLDLTLVGAPGCVLNVNPLIIDVMFGSPAGQADYLITCPGNTALAGFTLFMQPCKWDFTINALGIQTGNWARVIFGTRNL